MVFLGPGGLVVVFGGETLGKRAVVQCVSEKHTPVLFFSHNGPWPYW